jgi:hypothetical protein
MRDDEQLSSEDLVRQARESLGGSPTETPTDDAEIGSEIALDEDEIDALVEAELGPEPETTPAKRPRPRTPTPRIGPPDDAMRPAASPEAVVEGPVDERRGMLFAVGAALAGSFAWALLLAYAEIQSWLLALGIGWLIGTAALRGAGAFTSNLKVTVGALAVASVLFGEILGVALLFNKDFGFFDLAFAAEIYFENLDSMMGDFLFAVGGGALGAWTAINQGKKDPKTRAVG